jgi:hypothetical protein
MNQAAIALWGHLNAGSSQSTDLRDELGYLQYAEQTGGRDLGAVRSAREAVGAGARGVGGRHLRGAVEAYINASGNLSPKLNRVRSRQDAIASAAAGLQAVVLEGRELEAGRTVTAAEREVASVQARITNAKRRAATAINIASDLLQGKWTGAAVGLGKFLGTEIIGAGIEAAYASDLTEARANLQEARSNLERIQDEHQAARLDEAVARLSSANRDAQAAVDELIVAARQADHAQATLAEALRNMGFPGAAAALDARASVMQAADRALRKLAQYEGTVTTIGQRSENLKILNEGLANQMASSGADMLVANAEHQMEMFSAADHNRTVLGQIESWAQSEVGRIGDARAYVEAGDYLQDYDRIDTELSQALVYR